HPVREVLRLLRGGFRQIGDLAADDDAAAAGDRADRPVLVERRRLRGMVLEIPVRGADRLPDAVQVRLAVRHPRDLAPLGLGSARRAEQQAGGDDDGAPGERARESERAQHRKPPFSSVERSSQAAVRPTPGIVKKAYGGGWDEPRDRPGGATEKRCGPGRTATA